MQPVQFALLGVRLSPLVLASALASSAGAQCATQKLLAPGGFDLERGAASLALSGTTLLAGAHLADDQGADAGAALVYEELGGTWVHTQRLLGSQSAAGDEFGVAVALDGDVGVVGAHFHDSTSSGGGAAYVFERVGSVLVETARLVASDARSRDSFGRAVAVSGERIAVGAPLRDAPGFADAGAVYLFERAGSSWVEVDRITVFDGRTGDHFGGSLALDGDRMLVGAWLDDTPLTDAGSVYVFDRILGLWTSGLKVSQPSPTAFDNFGWSVALDGDRALVGATAARPTSPGSAHVLERLPTGFWGVTATLTPSDGLGWDYFGSSVALEGDVALVGAREHDHLGPQAGAAYVFDGASGSWVETGKLLSPDGTIDDEAGDAVALAGDVALVGSKLDDDVARDAGAVWEYSLGESGCATLVPDAYSLSVLAGGTVRLAIDADDVYGGGSYWLAGSASGPWPGLVLGGVTVPLNPDGYFAAAVWAPGSGVFGNNVGVLDAAGRALVTVTLAPALTPALVGLALHHAYVVFDPSVPAVLHASRAVPLVLTP